MTKALIKKQMRELFSFVFQDKKKNKLRSGRSLVISSGLYIVLFLYLSAMFFLMAFPMCESLVAIKMDWMYFALTGLAAIAFGAFGSVFCTYTSLYKSKDNEMLLSMPIKPGRLLLVRLLSVFAMGLLYELMVMLPVLISYYIVAPLNITTVIMSILTTIVISVIILILSVVLGFVVAVVSSKLKNKSAVTVIVSLLFLGVYFYAYSQAGSILQAIISEPQKAANLIKSVAYPLYIMGLSAAGDILSFVIFLAAVLAVFAVVYFVLSKSYINIATTSRGAAKKKYKRQTAKAATSDAALFRKEIKRFTSCPNYMLNCGLGSLFMVIGAVALLIRGDAVASIVNEVFSVNSALFSLIICGALCLISATNDITAPSVSLEGKNIWLVQVYPVSGWQVLKAKLKLHLAVTLLPLLILTASALFVFRPETAFMVLIPVVAVLYTVVMAEFGLAMNLLFPNLNWTSEITPIKQSMSVMVVLFGGWGISLALFGLYIAVAEFVSLTLYAAAAAVLLAAASVVLMLWLKNKGSKRFEALS